MANVEWRDRQRLAENAVSRFKALVGVKLASRELERQQVEVLVKSQVLNRMRRSGCRGQNGFLWVDPPEGAGGGLPCLEFE